MRQREHDTFSFLSFQISFVISAFLFLFSNCFCLKLYLHSEHYSYFKIFSLTFLFSQCLSLMLALLLFTLLFTPLSLLFYSHHSPFEKSHPVWFTASVYTSSFFFLSVFTIISLFSYSCVSSVQMWIRLGPNNWISISHCCCSWRSDESHSPPAASPASASSDSPF